MALLQSSPDVQPGRVPGLDALRGIAVLLVVFTHTTEATFASGVGVTIFFVLSGYLITSILLGELRTSGRIDFRAFYWRRALRLGPALLGLLVALPAAMVLVGDPRLDQVPAWLAVSGLYVMNFARAYFGMEETPLGHTWSLAVEEQFYLLWPPLLLLLVISTGDPRKLARRVLALTLVAVVWRGAAGVLTPDSFKFSLDANAFALLLGCLVAVRRSAGLRLPTGATACWGSLACLLLIACSPVVVEGEWLRAYYTMAAAPLSAVLVSAAHDLPRVLQLNPLIATGRISYGLYLWHFALLKLWFDGREAEPMWSRLGLVALSVVIAVLSWRFIEQPALRTRHAVPLRRGSAAARVPGQRRAPEDAPKHPVS